MDSPPASRNGSPGFDPATPFAGVVLCCTSIQPDQRTEIAQRTTDLGGIHKYDLTPEVTHLIVGEYDTPKYRHVARERPDVKAMAAGWVHAVRNLWMEDKEIDFAQLEADWTLKTFEVGGGNPLSPFKDDRRRRGLVCCLTGFEDQDERDRIEIAVTTHGAEFTGDLSRKVTHLIVHKPEGNKYRAARDWNIRTVSVEWLNDSIDRGMILEETCYDPLIPKDERGKGATREVKRASLGKRPREAAAAAPDEGRRKLRKSASMKFNAGGDSIWNQMVVQKSATDLSARPPMDQRSESMPVVAESYRSIGSASNPPPPASESTAAPTQPPEGGVFSSCRFFVHGFPQARSKIVCEHLVSHGGVVSPSLADTATPAHPEPADQRFLVVPQVSQPDTHPLLPKGVHIVTEFYLERCIHNKSLFHPNEHTLGQPFPLFPIDGFEHLIICTAGFKNEQLNQVEKAVSQLGAKYAEKLNTQTSLLVCPSIQDVRKQKLDFAILSKVPVVQADWLWECISTGFLAPWNDFLFPEVKQRLAIDVDPDLVRQKKKMQRSRSEPVTKKQPAPVRAPVHRSKVDNSGFQEDSPLPPVRENSGGSKPEGNVSHYDTAPSHFDDADAQDGGPSAEATTSALNKSPSPPKANQPPREPLKRHPTGGTVADSEGGDDLDALDSSHTPPSAAEDAETTRQRQTEAQSAAERLAMASRLNNLLPGGGNGTAAENASRRKRAIFGRAVSNASAGSSASAESSAADPAAAAATAATVTTRKPQQQQAGRVKSVSSLEGIIREGSQATAAADESTLAATQVDYDDPEARRHRAAVMDRMLGKKHGPAVKSPGARKTQERMTLERLQDEQGGSTTSSGGVRKSRRR